MVTTKLEIIFVFGAFCPLLFPLIIASLSSFIFFYVFAHQTLGWDIDFKHHEDGIKSFPFHFLSFGILCGQMLTFLFLRTDTGYGDMDWVNEGLSWTVLAVYAVVDTIGVFVYRRRMKKKAEPLSLFDGTGTKYIRL